MNPEHIDWVFLGAVYFCGFGCGMMCWYFVLRHFYKCFDADAIRDRFTKEQQYRFGKRLARAYEAFDREGEN